MTKLHLSNLPEGLTPKGELPLDLAVLFEWPLLKDMTAHEIHVWMEKRSALIRKNAARLREHGVDADQLIANQWPSLEGAAKPRRKLLEMREIHCKSWAELDASTFEVLMSLEPAIAKMSEENPSEPLYCDMKNALKDWRERMAKKLQS